MCFAKRESRGEGNQPDPTSSPPHETTNHPRLLPHLTMINAEHVKHCCLGLKTLCCWELGAGIAPNTTTELWRIGWHLLLDRFTVARKLPKNCRASKVVGTIQHSSDFIITKKPSTVGHGRHLDSHAHAGVQRKSLRCCDSNSLDTHAGPVLVLVKLFSTTRGYRAYYL